MSGVSLTFSAGGQPVFTGRQNYLNCTSLKENLSSRCSNQRVNLPSAQPLMEPLQIHVAHPRQKQCQTINVRQTIIGVLSGISKELQANNHHLLLIHLILLQKVDKISHICSPPSMSVCFCLKALLAR